eukprot:311678-Pleurochrysis_carterae.AAC.1
MVLEMVVPKAPKKSNRALGIYRPLSMCCVFTQRKHMKAELDNVLTLYGELAFGGDDFKGASWDIRHMMST